MTNVNLFNRGIMTVFVKYPNLAIGAVVLSWAATGGCAVYQHCQPSPDEIYRKGVDKGYEKAREELREQGKEGVKLSIRSLTTWNAKLLGDEYVVHIPLEKDDMTRDILLSLFSFYVAALLFM